MSDPLPLDLRLDDPDPDRDTAVSRIVASHLAARRRSLAFAPAPPETLWPAEHFGLHEVTLFRQASPDQQNQILAHCARGLLNEAYFIEKSGSAYCAKMILLAESAEVRQVYSLIAADEASHLQWIRPYIPETDRAQPEGELLRFLSELIEQCDRNTLAYLVQIILEGWGLSHYRSLAQSCRDQTLQAVFQLIHKDEALHHHTGEVIFDPAQVTSAAQHTLIRDSLRHYSEMVRVGPQAVVRALALGLGGLSEHDKVSAFTELRTEETTGAKLQLLRRLMIGPGREPYVAELERHGAFTPYPPELCAAILGEPAPPSPGSPAATAV